MAEAYDKSKSYKIGDVVTSDKAPRYRGEVSFTKVEGKENEYVAIEKKQQSTKSRSSTKSNTEVVIETLKKVANTNNGPEAISKMLIDLEEGEISTIIKGLQAVKAEKVKQAKEKKVKLDKLKALGMSAEEIEELLSDL